MARDKSEKLSASLPANYRPDFLTQLDGRTTLGKAVRERHEAILTDLGGPDSLSSIKLSLVRRFVWFEAMIEGMECRAAASEPVDVGVWTQLVNSWLGIARMLGLERRPKRLPSVAEYLKASKGNGHQVSA
jgi:hypothetical protein